LFKTEICSWKSQNTIKTPQNLLEHLFTIPVRTFQVSFQGMPLGAAIQARPGNGAPTERPTQHAHTSALRGKRSERPPSPTS
jgi:hypothetical protein